MALAVWRVENPVTSVYAERGIVLVGEPAGAEREIRSVDGDPVN